MCIKTFKDAIRENTDSDGLIHWDKIEVPDLDFKGPEDIVEVHPHVDENLLVRFGKNRAKVVEIINHNGPVNLSARDLEESYGDTNDVDLVEFFTSDHTAPIQNLIAQFKDGYADFDKIKCLTLVITTHPEYKSISMQEMGKLAEFINTFDETVVAFWAYQYNESVLQDTVKLNVIIGK